jgi:hypothetical protein
MIDVSLRKDTIIVMIMGTGFFRCNRWAEENDHQFYDGAAHNSNEVPANPSDGPANVGSYVRHGYARKSSGS